MATCTPLIQNKQVIALFIILQELTELFEQERQLERTEHILENFKHAMNSAADISVTDINGVIVDMNDRFMERTGYSREEILGHTHQIVNSRYHSKQFFINLWATLRSGHVWRGEICNRNKNGVTYWNETTIIPLFDHHGEISQYLGVHIDISEKKRIMTKLHHVEKTFRLITENTNDLIIVTDEFGLIMYVSPSYVRLLGYREDELIGRFYEQILHDDSKQEWQKLSTQTMHRGIEIHLELQLKSKSGKFFWTEAHCKVVEGKSNLSGHQIIMLSRETTARKERESKLIFMAYHDSLTSLPNRSYMVKEFPVLCEKVDSQLESIAVIYIDGDDFKSVNDRFGHDVGDEFLKHFSNALLQCVRLNDLVVRLGGDEFIILLTGISRDADMRRQQVASFVQRVRNRLQQGWLIGNHHFQPTSSMGIAFYPDHATKLDQLLELADEALYNKKKISKNNYQIYQ